MGKRNFLKNMGEENFFEKFPSPRFLTKISFLFSAEGRNFFSTQLPPLHTTPLPKTFGATLRKNALAFLRRVKKGLRYAKISGGEGGLR